MLDLLTAIAGLALVAVFPVAIIAVYRWQARKEQKLQRPEPGDIEFCEWTPGVVYYRFTMGYRNGEPVKSPWTPAPLWLFDKNDNIERRARKEM
jgi:hypothetical protein